VTLDRRLIDLCAIPSPYGNEKAIADFVERELRATPFSATVMRIGNSVVAGRPSGKRPAIALCGHLDTVPDPGNAWPPRRDGDLVFGSGASDMKSGLAVMLMLARERRFEDLILVFYDKEEGPYDANGLEPVLDACPWMKDVGLAFCLEPTDLELQLGCVGSLHADVVFSGKSAHSARPWQGENAITKAAPFLAELAALRPRDVEPEPGLVYREVMTVTLAKGGLGRNLVPPSFELHVNVRFAPGRSPMQAEEDLRALVRGRGEVVVTDRSPSARVPRDNPLLDRFKRIAGSKIAPKQAWTDVARLAARGIDAVNFGPGYTAQAHQKDERASIDMAVRAFETFVKFLAG
jgi:succinyl-diaminopimelate desuccinylase